MVSSLLRFHRPIEGRVGGDITDLQLRFCILSQGKLSPKEEKWSFSGHMVCWWQSKFQNPGPLSNALSVTPDCFHSPFLHLSCSMLFLFYFLFFNIFPFLPYCFYKFVPACKILPFVLTQTSSNSQRIIIYSMYFKKVTQFFQEQLLLFL